VIAMMRFQSFKQTKLLTIGVKPSRLRFCFFVFALTVASVHPVSAEDLEQTLESLLSFEEERRIGVAEISGCKLLHHTEYKITPAPDRIRSEQITVDLTRVGEVEQRNGSDRIGRERTLVYLNPHGFGNPFKTTIPLNWVRIDEHFDGRTIKETFSRRLAIVLPLQEDKKTLSRYFEKYISNYCGETF
jgi:hypothetical protein